MIMDEIYSGMTMDTWTAGSYWKQEDKVNTAALIEKVK